ncbi:chitin deacetylase [Borealophlyctis nickersoniae]|nr:chitin deacetylase [Borealophlyctis nickersoniae]
MVSKLVVLALVAAAVNVNAQDLPMPPPMPAAWPSSDETQFITGAFLQDKLVTDAMAYVRRVVKPELLAVKPSTYVMFAQVNYNDDAVKYGHGVIRTADTADYKAEITTCPGVNQWGLTYDDGPTLNLVNGVHTADTGAIRQKLAGLGLKATFFSVGGHAAMWQDELKQTFKEGHQIAVHTWTHHPLTSLTNEQLVAEIKYTEAMIYKNTGKVPNYFRPPYGEMDDRVRAILTALGYTNVIWGIGRDSTDTATPQNATLVQNTIQSWFSGGPGFISLQHDINQYTCTQAVNALDAVKAARDAGRFKLNPMPVGQCLGTPWYRDGTSSNAAADTTTTTTTTTVAPTTTTSTPTPTKVAVTVPAGNSATGVSTGVWGTLIAAAMAVAAAAGLV